MRHFLLLVPLFFAGFAVAAQAGEPLRVSWGAHNAPPYAIVRNDRLVSGIIHDIGDALAAKIHTSAEYVDVPRARYEEQLLTGTIHLTCITSPAWLAHANELLWSPPLFEETDLFVQREGTTPWKSVSEASNRRIGTIQAYRYPSLEELFANGTLVRDDGNNLDSNMTRLTLGRVDAVVDADIPIRYWLRAHNHHAQLPLAKFEVSKHDVQCAISPRAPQGATVIRDALTGLSQTGQVKAILTRYIGDRSSH